MINIHNGKKVRFVLLFITVFFCGFLTHFFLVKIQKKTLDSGLPVRQNSSDFQYINPLLYIDNSEENFTEYQPLEGQIKRYISKAQERSSTQSVSVYFRDLNTSHWGGVNENDRYAPSSMLKVIVLLNYLKIAERDPDILTRKVFYEYKDSYGEYYKVEKRLTNGYHTILELLQYMIIESDNTSMSILVALQRDELLEVYKDLRLPSILEGPDDFMSAEQYSYVFRTLYNTTYLKRSLSEAALRLLTYTKFNKGLISGVASSTVVAHKFGEHTVVQDGLVLERQLHDCGIVYHPGKPYFVCIMSKGKDFESLEKVIGDLSKIIFDFVKKSDE